MATVHTQRHRITIEQIGLKYGLILAGANTGFFLLMAAFGLDDQTWLRFINLAFIFFVVYRGLQYFKHHTASHWTYLKGLGLGTYIVLVGAALFSIFLFFYSLLDNNFVDAVNTTMRLNINFSPLFVAAVVFLETVIYGFILVFACMQRLKTTHMKDGVHI